MTPDYQKAAMSARSDLNVFAVVVTILEGGHVYCPNSNVAVAKIIKICKAEQRKRLREMDWALAQASK